MRVQLAPWQDYDWLLSRTGFRPTADFRAIEALDKAGNIRGMVGFDGWTQTGCFMHVAIDSPIVARHLTRPAFHYAFREFGREHVLALIRASNTQSLSFSKSIGFRELHRIEDGWKEGEDTVLLEMRKRNCRWLKAERKAA